MPKSRVPALPSIAEAMKEDERGSVRGRGSDYKRRSHFGGIKQ